MSVIFDESSHTYTYKGKVLPSVTTILGAVYGDPTGGHGLQWHMDRGSAAHQLYAIMGKGEDLGRYDWDKRLSGHVRAWVDWSATEKPLFSTLVEVPLHYRGLYAGTPDAVCVIRGKTVLIDYKQSCKGRDRLQLAAYLLMIEENTGLKPTALASLQMREDEWKYGQVLDRPHEIARAKADWLATLRVYFLQQRRI